MLATDSIDLKDDLALCYKHLGVFGKTFLPDAFDRTFSKLHTQILDLIDSGERRIAIAAPRGLGKTTIAKALTIRSILFRDYEFITYNSQSETSAMMQRIRRRLIVGQSAPSPIAPTLMPRPIVRVAGRIGW